MKKFGKILTCSLAAAMGLGLVGCNNPAGNIDTSTEQYAKYQLYVSAAQAAGDPVQTYEEWLASIKGADGEDGEDGKDGATWLTNFGVPSNAIGKDGDFYLNKTNWMLYQKDEGEWNELTIIKGLDGQGEAGNGIASITKEGATVNNVDTYKITFTNGTSTTFTVTNGENGANGKSAYEIAVDNGFEGSKQEWLESLNGADGNGITSVEITSSNGNVDTYTITFSNGSSSTFTVTNGENGSNGVSIVSVEKTNTEDNVDTYTITFSNQTSTTFTVTNGIDGEDGNGVSEVALIGSYFSSYNTRVDIYEMRYTDTEKDPYVYYVSNFVDGYVCSIDLGDGKVQPYASLAEAVAEVKKDNVQVTINIEEDIVDGGVKVYAGQNIVFNLNGHSFTIDQPTVGSAGTETLAFQLLKDSTVKFMDGKLLQGENGCKMMIQNYADLTLEDVIVDARANDYAENICQYAVSNNCGSLTVKGRTQIWAEEGQIAFDLWYGMSATYDAGVTVTFANDFTGKVVGPIEYGAAKRAAAGWEEKTALIIENGSFDFDLRFTSRTLNPNIKLNGGSFDLEGKTVEVNSDIFAQLLVEKDGERVVDAYNGTVLNVETNQIVEFDKRGDIVKGVKEVEGYTAYTEDANGIGTIYQTLKEAVEAVPADGTEVEIFLTKDTYGPGIKVRAGQNIVFNLGGHAYTISQPTVGSAGTETLAFQLLKGSTVKFMDGSLLQGENGCKMMIQNYANLTLEDMIVDARAEAGDEFVCQYALSNNFGSATITGETYIYAAQDQVAFDLWYGMFETYDEGVTVTFDDNFTGRVEGKIEYGAAKRAAAGWEDKTVLNLFAGRFASEIVGSSSNIEYMNINITNAKFDVCGQTINVPNEAFESTKSYIVNGIVANSNYEYVKIDMEGNIVYQSTVSSPEMAPVYRNLIAADLGFIDVSKFDNISILDYTMSFDGRLNDEDTTALLIALANRLGQEIPSGITSWKDAAQSDPEGAYWLSNSMYSEDEYMYIDFNISSSPYDEDGLNQVRIAIMSDSFYMEGKARNLMMQIENAYSFSQTQQLDENTTMSTYSSSDSQIRTITTNIDGEVTEETIMIDYSGATYYKNVNGVNVEFGRTSLENYAKINGLDSFDLQNIYTQQLATILPSSEVDIYQDYLLSVTVVKQDGQYFTAETFSEQPLDMDSNQPPVTTGVIIHKDGKLVGLEAVEFNANYTGYTELNGTQLSEADTIQKLGPTVQLFNANANINDELQYKLESLPTEDVYIEVGTIKANSQVSVMIDDGDYREGDVVLISGSHEFNEIDAFVIEDESLKIASPLLASNEGKTITITVDGVPYELDIESTPGFEYSINR